MNVELVKQVTNGVERKQFEYSLQSINEQIRRMEQQLTLKIERQVMDYFYHCETEITSTLNSGKKIRKLKRSKRQHFSVFNPEIKKLS